MAALSVRALPLIERLAKVRLLTILEERGVTTVDVAHEALPYAGHSFEMLWAERVLIYVPDVRQAVSEMRRVLRPGGRAALIEPDISSSTINLKDRALVRRVMGHEADTNVAYGWLPGLLRRVLEERLAFARSSLRPG
jgi:ubiquinone/menaquinone biosynthesis C-methylase UbiE